MSQPPIDPDPAPTTPAGSARSDPGRSAARAVLVYTAGRIVAFLVSLGVLRLLGFRTYALFLGALLLSALLSLLLLRRQRAAVSESLATRVKRDALTPRRSGRRAAPSGEDAGEDADAHDPYADDEADDEPGRGPGSAGPADATDRSATPRP